MNKSCLRLLTSKQIVGHGGFKGLLKHDERESIWRNQEILDELRKENEALILRELEEVTEENRRIIKEKTGRKMQETTMHVREAVMELPDSCTMEEMRRVGELICKTPILRSVNELRRIDGKKTLVSIPLLDENGKQVISPLNIQLFALFFHKDEGHWVNADGSSAMLSKDNDGNWTNPDGKAHDPKKEGLFWKPHYHGHIWFDMINKDTGTTIRISADELSQIQDIVAQELGMERGIRGSTRPYLDREAYRKKKIHEALMEEYAQEEQAKKEEIEELDNQIVANMVKIKRSKLALEDAQRREAQARDRAEEVQLIKAVNPQLNNFVENLREMHEAKMRKEDIREVFRNGKKEGIDIPVIYNNKTYLVETTVDLCKDEEGQMHVWFDDMRLDEFKKHYTSHIKNSIGNSKGPKM